MGDAGGGVDKQAKGFTPRQGRCPGKGCILVSPIAVDAQRIQHVRAHQHPALVEATPFFTQTIHRLLRMQRESREPALWGAGKGGQAMLAHEMAIVRAGQDGFAGFIEINR